MVVIMQDTDGTTTRTAVLVSLGSAAPAEALRADVEQLRDRGYRVHLVSRVAPVPTLAEVLDGRTAVGRPTGGTLQVSKLKLDPHRLPGAAVVVLGGTAGPLVRQADVLVAVDATALPAVWLAARVNRRALAVNGLPAAVSRLT